MPETSPQGQTSANPSTTTPPKRSRPPGEMGGHTVMPWEQDETRTSTSHIPGGSDVASAASGGSSKSVPPPSAGKSVDGLGQGAGASTVTAAESRLGRPELEEHHPEGAERRKGSMTVGRDDAPQDAMAGAPPTAFKATPQATRDAPEDQIRGGDATKPSQGSLGGPDTKKPVTPTASGTLPKPSPKAADKVAHASAPTPGSTAALSQRREQAPNPLVPSTGSLAGAAKEASAHPTHPSLQQGGKADPQEDQLIEALDKRLAEMLARALHETVAAAVREARAEARPPAPPPVQPVGKT